MTTSSTMVAVPIHENRPLRWLCLATIAVLGISRYHPAMVADWYLENLLALAVLAWLAATYRWMPLSNLSYLLIFVFFCFHELGAHYKYAEVPLGEWMKSWLHTQRNHYDRVMHFCYGLLFSYPLQEVYVRTTRIRDAWSYTVPVFVVLGLGSVYEMMESALAALVSIQASDAFVGMQGDMWDAQKDMAMNGLGAVTAMTALWLIRNRRAGCRP